MTQSAQGAADEAAACRPRRSFRPDRRPAAPQQLPPGRLHPADAVQVDRGIGVRLHNLDEAMLIFAVPFGEYIAIDRGITRSGRLVAAQQRPVTAGALQDRRRLRQQRLLQVGGGAQRLRRGDRADHGRPRLRGQRRELVHGSQWQARSRRAVSDDILEGITRDGPDRAGARGAWAWRRSAAAIDRSELYAATEVFLCGTGAQISPIVEIDHRPVGNGEVGPITRKLATLYFDAVRGRMPQHSDWLTPIY